eukprot:1144829-Pelagomonas_calceolata.AAC.6
MELAVLKNVFGSLGAKEQTYHPHNNIITHLPQHNPLKDTIIQVRTVGMADVLFTSPTQNPA